MGITESRRLFIRSLITTASELVPFFWPMRNFIHHNPLYNFESKKFEDAVKEAEHLFHGRTLPDLSYFRRQFKRGEIDTEVLKEEILRFVKEEFPEEDEEALTESIFRIFVSDVDIRPKRNLYVNRCREAGDVAERIEDLVKVDAEAWMERFLRDLGRRYTVYDAVDLLFGTEIGRTLDDLMIKLCMEFLDEGQAVWGMPLREEGFFKAWGKIAVRSKRLRMCGCADIEKLIDRGGTPEEAVEVVMRNLNLPEEIWEDYFTLESFKLHGWMGFIRWRSHARDYYWQRKHPVSEVDYLAVRLIISLSLLRNLDKDLPFRATYTDLVNFVKNNPEEAFVRYEYFSKKSPPSMLEEIHTLLSGGGDLKRIYSSYVEEKRRTEIVNRALVISKILKDVDLPVRDPRILYEVIERLKEKGSMVWLRALERSKIKELVRSLNAEGEERRKRPLAQALFCIDVRSERFRRNLERLGEYETYGIAGFFGVPISFVDLKRGHETYLCPVLIKPKNVVLEVHRELSRGDREDLKEIIKEILHDLKYNILTPYITVEAIGLLFGFDMIGKTLFPLRYGTVREKLGEDQNYNAKLMIDKLSREEALEIISLLQKEIIRKVLREEFKLKDTSISDDLLEKVRRVALEEAEEDTLDEVPDPRRLVELLRSTYRIEKGYMRIQLEKLAKIGFTLEEQVFFVERALRSVGLTDNFARVVLVLGHGSKSENNPYESALDCGACGGDHGYINARVFAYMANKREVREHLRKKGINIPEDTVFIAGEHNTTTDQVILFDLDLIPPELTPYLRKIMEDLKVAGKLTAMERCRELPTSGSCADEEEAFREVMRNSLDWTQVRPEWGLSGNYAFIIGRRHLTEKANLNGKVFLHSYDYRKDPKGFFLEIILSGPLVVGEWINMEHFFSSVDNERFGSGSKVYHNVVGRFGVITGNYSDLRTGLPAQTVLRGGEPFHTPLRLITVIEAPLDTVKRVVSRIPKVRELVYNEWINTVVLDPMQKKVFFYREGNWTEL